MDCRCSFPDPIPRMSQPYSAKGDSSRMRRQTRGQFATSCGAYRTGRTIQLALANVLAQYKCFSCIFNRVRSSQVSIQPCAQTKFTTMTRQTTLFGCDVIFGRFRQRKIDSGLWHQSFWIDWPQQGEQNGSWNHVRERGAQAAGRGEILNLEQRSWLCSSVHGSVTFRFAAWFCHVWVDWSPKSVRQTEPACTQFNLVFANCHLFQGEFWQRIGVKNVSFVLKMHTQSPKPITSWRQFMELLIG